MKNFESIIEPQTKEEIKAEIKKIAFLDLKAEMWNTIGLEKKEEVTVLAWIDFLSEKINPENFKKLCSKGLNLA